MDWTSRKIQCRLSNNQKKLLKFLQFLNRDLYRLRHSHAYNIFLAPLLIRRGHIERKSVGSSSHSSSSKVYHTILKRIVMPFLIYYFKTHPQEIMALYRRFYWTNLYSLLFIHSCLFFYWKRLLHHYIYSIVHISSRWSVELYSMNVTEPMHIFAIFSRQSKTKYCGSFYGWCMWFYTLLKVPINTHTQPQLWLYEIEVYIRTVEHFDSSFNCSPSSSSLIRRSIVDFFLFLSRSLFNRVDTLVETSEQK